MRRHLAVGLLGFLLLAGIAAAQTGNNVRTASDGVSTSAAANSPAVTSTSVLEQTIWTDVLLATLGRNSELLNETTQLLDTMGVVDTRNGSSPAQATITDALAVIESNGAHNTASSGDTAQALDAIAVVVTSPRTGTPDQATLTDSLAVVHGTAQMIKKIIVIS